MKKTIMAIFLMVGLFFSGCNSTLKESPKRNKNSKKTSSTESSVYSKQNTSNTLVPNSLDKVDTEPMVEAVKPDRDLIYEKCSYPIIRDIYEGAKDRIASELSKIEHFDVKLEYNKEYYDQTEKKLHSVWNPGDGEEYTIEVSQIEFDADKLYILFNIPDGYSAGSFQGIIMYLKSERKETDSLFVSSDGDYIPASAMDKCNTTYEYMYYVYCSFCKQGRKI